MKALHPGKTILILFVAAVPLLLMAASALAAAPGGTGPNDPAMVPAGPQTIAPNTTLWFYFDYEIDRSGPGGFPGGGRRGGFAAPGKSSTASKANITVDANGASGLAFAVYTPEQGASWLGDPTTAPVGRGTPYRDTSNDTITHDLYWSGGFNTSGRYLIALTNSSSDPLSFNLTVTGDDVLLYPPATLVPTPTLPVPFTVTPVPTGTIQGKVLFETATGGDIYTVDGDGSNLTRVSHGIDPSWSPDGKQITFARWDNTSPGLYIANADGSNEQLLYTAPRVRWPRWSPDGKYIVFAQDKTQDGKATTWKLGLIDLATGKLTEPRCSALCFVPSWGPDSASLVYTDPNIGIMAANAFDGAETLLGPTGRYWDAGANISRPIVNWPPMELSELSPDGTRIVYTMEAHDRWELNLMNADGSGQTGLTNPDPIQYYLMGVADHNVAPTWSPDGKQILFLSDRNGKWEFFTMQPDGSNIQQVLKNVTDQVAVKFTYENERIVDWTR